MRLQRTFEITLFTLLVVWLACVLVVGVAHSAEPVRLRVSDARWNPGKCVLTWRGAIDGRKRTYKIDYHAGTMTDGKRTYGLSREEQAVVHEMLVSRYADLLDYAASSAIWFDQGGVYPARPLVDAPIAQSPVPPPDPDVVQSPVPPPDPDARMLEK